MWCLLLLVLAAAADAKEWTTRANFFFFDATCNRKSATKSTTMSVVDCEKAAFKARHTVFSWNGKHGMDGGAYRRPTASAACGVPGIFDICDRFEKLNVARYFSCCRSKKLAYTGVAICAGSYVLVIDKEKLVDISDVIDGVKLPYGKTPSPAELDLSSLF